MLKQKQEQSDNVQQGVQINLPICHRKNCLHKDGPVIKDLCYVFVQPCLIIQRYFAETPPIFKSPEHAANHCVGMSFHTECWQQELRDHGVTLFDMSKIKQTQKQTTIPDKPKIRPRVGKPNRRQKKKKR